jgi:hypothetical protein
LALLATSRRNGDGKSGDQRPENGSAHQIPQWRKSIGASPNASAPSAHAPSDQMFD